MKNHGNTIGSEKFNPPTQHDAYMKNPQGIWVDTGKCLVYDPRAWRQN